MNNEINTAKKLKKKIDFLFSNDESSDELSFGNLFHKVIQEIESQEPTSLTKQFEQNVLEFNSLSKETTSVDQINSLKDKLDNLLTKYNEQLININKYNAKSTQKLAITAKEKVEKIFDIIEIFLTPQDEQLILTKEVRQDITDKEFDGSLGSFQKGINSLTSVEKETTIDKQIFSYNTAKFHFEEALQKYQNQNKLKKLFSYVLENKEFKNVYNKKINILNEETISQKNMIKWLYFFCIFDIFILILIIIYISYFCNKNKQKLKNTQDLS
ncbi:hypothetical protein C6B37_00120 [Candidatus Phytoplasma phoenicium]|uniref:Uncharacterized protein n=1 Tax=Candidatus Phytoplasma phoenicium TaxID=198422 RepID=A0A2S8NVM8_9MOLU|nr:hypothetical protein C6B37_00120 [Candidatus Phytoplasma phoenicium]